MDTKIIPVYWGDDRSKIIGTAQVCENHPELMDVLITDPEVKRLLFADYTYFSISEENYKDE